MLKQAKIVGARRRRSASISLVLIASSVMVAGCDQRVSAGDVAYRDAFRNADDCRRDYGYSCTAGGGGAGGGGHGAWYGPYLVNSNGRPSASPSSMGVEPTVLSADTAARINSGAEVSRGGGTSRGGFGGEGHGGGGEGGHGGGGGGE
jgi:hypothetical protein